jgi:predicted DNA-binding protein with PD1-like motif
LVLRASSGESLPDGLVARLREEKVACGWLRASGVLVDVDLRAFGAELNAPNGGRRVAGPVHILSLGGAIGLAGGEPSISLRALLARETAQGLETLAGEIAGARIVAFEAVVTVLDDLQIERSLDEAAGVWLFRGEVGPAASPRASPARPAAATSWSTALEASVDSDREPPSAHVRPSGEGGTMPAPIRPPRQARPGADLDAPVPDPGDIVEHFAFGLCDVLKSDGDRLHLRVHKDGRIREIALEMLRVARLDDTPAGTRHFKLERRI